MEMTCANHSIHSGIPQTTIDEISSNINQLVGAVTKRDLTGATNIKDALSEG
jgi:hypothetical protein